MTAGLLRVCFGLHIGQLMCVNFKLFPSSFLWSDKQRHQHTASFTLPTVNPGFLWNVWVVESCKWSPSLPQWWWRPVFSPFPPWLWRPCLGLTFTCSEKWCDPVTTSRILPNSGPQAGSVNVSLENVSRLSPPQSSTRQTLLLQNPHKLNFVLILFKCLTSGARHSAKASRA